MSVVFYNVYQTKRLFVRVFRMQFNLNYYCQYNLYLYNFIRNKREHFKIFFLDLKTMDYENNENL